MVSTDHITMKLVLVIILLYLSFKSFAEEATPASKAELLALQAAFESQKTLGNLEGIAKYIEKTVNEKKSRPTLIKESIVSSRAQCYYCPPHIQLTESINGILQKMKTNASVEAAEDIPVSINKLNLLFYIVKSRMDDGSVTCDRFLDRTRDFVPTSFPGRAELVLEDVFKFDSISQMQLIDPKKEEILYYYRGEGDERNIIVEARLTKDGGRLRYFYYRPISKEENPYNLPDLGDAPNDVTVKKKSMADGVILKKSAADLEAERQEREAVVEQKASPFNYAISPKVEMRNKFIPKDVHLATSTLSQGILDTGISINGSSALSLSGNKAQLNFKNEQGHSYAVLDLHTSLNGRSTRTLIVPYEIKLGDSTNPDGPKLSGHLEDNLAQTMTTFSLTDSTTSYFRTEIRRNKVTGHSSYVVARDFIIGKAEAIAVAVGKNETNASYASLQHRKTIKDNITMVLDVRYDADKKAMLMYQVRAQF